MKKLTNNGDLFLQCVRKLYIDTKRDFIIAFSAGIGFWLVIGLIMGLLKSGGGDGEFAMFIFTAGIFCTIMPSLAFSDMKRKEGRINFLMQPAAAYQKFWSRLLLTIPIPIIVSFIGFYAIECGRIIGTAIISGRWIPMVSPWHAGSLSGAGATVMILSLLASQMFFFFGGILWPKMSYLKSLAVMALLYTIIMISSSCFIIHHAHLFIKLDMSTYRLASICVSVFLILLFGVLTYRRLIHSTVVYRLRQ